MIGYPDRHNRCSAAQATPDAIPNVHTSQRLRLRLISSMNNATPTIEHAAVAMNSSSLATGLVKLDAELVPCSVYKPKELLEGGASRSCEHGTLVPCHAIGWTFHCHNHSNDWCSVDMSAIYLRAPNRPRATKLKCDSNILSYLLNHSFWKSPCLRKGAKFGLANICEGTFERY